MWDNYRKVLFFVQKFLMSSYHVKWQHRIPTIVQKGGKFLTRLGDTLNPVVVLYTPGWLLSFVYPWFLVLFFLYLDLSVEKMAVPEKIIRVESFFWNSIVYECYIHGSKWMKFFFHISKKNFRYFCVLGKPLVLCPVQKLRLLVFYSR